MKEKIHFIILCVLAGWCNNTWAQIPGLRKYTQMDGFTATFGYRINQDEKGYIWLGTESGGVTFDGKKFKALQETYHSLNMEMLTCIPLSRDSILLVPLAHDLSYLDHGTLITAIEDSRLKNTRSWELPNAFCDPVTGAWWLSSYKAPDLFRFLNNDIQYYEITQPDYRMYGAINNLLIAININNYYLGTYDIQTQTFNHLYDESGSKMKSGPEDGLIASSTGKARNYFVFFRKRNNTINICKYAVNDSVLRLVRSIALPAHLIGPFDIRDEMIDRNQHLWIRFAGKKGIGYYGSIKENQAHQNAFYFMPDETINDLFVDRNNNLWLSTQNNTLFFLSEKHFKNALATDHFPLKKEIPKSISGNGRGLCLSYVNYNALAITHNKNHKIIQLNDCFKEGSPGILPLKDNRYIIFNSDVACFDMDHQTLHYFKLPFVSYKDVSLYGDTGLLAASGSFLLYIPSFLKSKPEFEEIFPGRTTAVEVLTDKRILIGTPIGLYMKQQPGAPAIKLKHPVLAESTITDIQAMPDGSALVSTNAELFIINGRSGAVKPLKIAGHKNSNHVKRLYRQNDSIYWAATDNGAYSLVFNKHWSVIASQNYTFYDGLPSSNIADIYVCRDTAYFATTQGLGIIPLKDSSRLAMAPPDIYINTIQSNDTVFREPYNSISLPYNQNNILVSLSAISYESLGSLYYSYRLYPYQDKWIQTTDPDIRFIHLPPGKYVFEAYAQNAKGRKSIRPVTLSIYIKPAFWQTLYFKIGLVTLAAILLYLAMRWGMQSREKKKYEQLQQKKHLAELELEAIKAQINPHFIYNCLNSIQYLNYKTDYAQAQRYLGLFARLIRSTMQYSQRTFITLTEEVDYLSNYLQLEKLRFKEKLHYDIYMADDIQKNSFIPAMLLQPYVENALKHGIAGREQGGQVWIQFQKEENNLLITVRDNGPGFSNLHATGTLGLRISGTRARSYKELFNLDIKVQCYNEQDNDSRKTGAVVKIIIPIADYGNTIH